MDARHAQRLLAEMRGKRVAVVGDLALDRYIVGSASRISQEAPVPIVLVKERRAVPGCAANVVRNLAGLGVHPIALGVIGDDAAGDELCRLLGEDAVDLSGILRDGERETIEKSRIVAGGQQIVRVDSEDVRPITETQRATLVECLEKLASRGDLDGVIVEDYAKGTVTQGLLTDIVKAAAPHGIPVALDPHPGNAHAATGLALATPNRREAFALTGTYFENGRLPLEDDAPLLEVAGDLRALWHPQHLLITFGAGGMALFSDDEPPLHVPSQALEVFDISGAGDTVVTSFFLATLAGASGPDACLFATHAAGVVVGKMGTASASSEEIIRSFTSEGEE